MPQFAYEALDRKGVTKSGTLTAPTEKVAVEKIKSRALYPVKIYQVLSDAVDAEPVRRGHLLLEKLGLGRHVPLRHFIPFVNDLASLIDAGIPLVRSLTLLEEQTPSAGLKEVVSEIRRDVEGGSSFTDALKHHPHVFNPLFINMIYAGEVGGILDQALNRLAAFAEKSAELKARIRSAIAYPVFVLLFALAVVLYLVAYVVPQMFVIFEDLGSELPAITLWLYGVSTFLRTRWYVVILAVFGLIAGFRLLQRVPRVRYRLDLWQLKVPVFGALARKVALARFARSFSTLTQSGVPILTTLSVVQESTGNMVFAHALAEVRASIREGEGIAGPLAGFSIFPAVVTNMVRVGEETGALAEVLAKVANKYDEEVERTLQTLTSLLEPLLIITLGFVVGFIVIALFLPMVPLIESLTEM